MSSPLLPPTFLFRFSFPCRYVATPWTAKGAGLDESHILPPLAALDGVPEYAEVRAGWHETGVLFSVRVVGKRQAPWCRDNRLEDSDGLRVWLDTRDTHNIHRASRFCHQFVFLPTGGGHRLDQPVADQLIINRARENANPVRPGTLRVRTEKRVDGYLLEAFVPAQALTGYDSADYSRLGFFYAVIDRELGTQSLGLSQEFPYAEDPSVWATLELVE